MTRPLVDTESDTENAAELARAQCRAAFFEALGPEPLSDVAAQAIDTGAAAVEGSLKAEPPHGVIEGATTAWAEARAIVQADRHDLRELLVQELHGLAAQALADLPARQRRGLWAYLEPHECDQSADLWSRAGSEAFDPLRAWPGSLDIDEERIVRHVLSNLAEAA